jgi:predicted ATP-binding protein involved in virulence
MRIDHLRLINFKKYADLELRLHPRFTLLAGDNGSGKTTILDALAISLGIWLVEPPDRFLLNSRRPIRKHEIRLIQKPGSAPPTFMDAIEVFIIADGYLTPDFRCRWQRSIKPAGTRTTNESAREALAHIKALYQRDRAGQTQTLPIMAYYGAGRAWIPANQPRKAVSSKSPPRRWQAFYDCLNERIREAELMDWYRRAIQTPAAYHQVAVVQHAIMRCLPGATGLTYDHWRQQVIVQIGDISQPFDNLSAGQRMMVAMVADIAIKAVTQNPHLTEPGTPWPAGDLPRVLLETPGVILIDELDVHLHPKWQRQVAADLQATFPAMQFIATSHSPQVIGELAHEQIRLLQDPGPQVSTPPYAQGMDSNRVLEDLMGASSRASDMTETLHDLAVAIDDEDFPRANAYLADLVTKLGEDAPEVTHARSLMHFLGQAAGAGTRP